LPDADTLYQFLKRAKVSHHTALIPNIQINTHSDRGGYTLSVKMISNIFSSQIVDWNRAMIWIRCLRHFDHRRIRIILAVNRPEVGLALASCVRLTCGVQTGKEKINRAGLILGD